MGCTSSSSPLPIEQGWIHIHEKRNIPLTEKQKDILKEMWTDVEKNKVTIARVMFLRLFKKFPFLKQLFPEFKDTRLSELESSSQKLFRGHAKRWMVALEHAIAALDDAETFISYAEELGRRHITRALKVQYLNAMGDAFLYSMKDYFQDKWTPEVQDAWEDLFNFIAAAMRYGIENAHIKTF